MSAEIPIPREAQGLEEDSARSTKKAIFTKELEKVGQKSIDAETGLEYYTVPEPIKFLEWATRQDFLLHGTREKVAGNFMPSRAYDANKESGNRNAIYTSQRLPIVLFFAVVGKRNREGSAKLKTSVSIKPSGEIDEVSVGYVDKEDAIGEQGFVYIFSKEQADEFANDEFLSYKPQKPVGVIQVTRKDVPFPIRTTSSGK
jgi:hypothetical protein